MPVDRTHPTSVEATAQALAGLRREIRVLKIALATVVVVVVAAGADPVRPKPKFAEIDVERINVVEADGTVRLVVSNQARFPEVVLDGKTIKGRSGGKTAGLLFYNDRGECGGLSFGGGDRAGRHAANAGLMFDQYRQDQTVGIIYTDANGRRSAGLRVWDRPDMPLTELLDRVAAIKKMPDGPEKTEAARALERVGGAATRVVVGKSDTKAAVVMLADARGRPRIRLVVEADGDPRLEFLDETGKLTHRLPPAGDRKE
jgi:hypothetical protein